MAEDKDNDAALQAQGNKGGNVSGQQPEALNGPAAGSAANTRGENKPSREGTSGGAKHGKDTPDQDSPQGSNANATTTRGSDSTDKEFRNNQPNASTLKEDMKNAGPAAGQDQK